MALKIPHARTQGFRARQTTCRPEQPARSAFPHHAITLTARSTPVGQAAWSPGIDVGTGASAFYSILRDVIGRRAGFGEDHDRGFAFVEPSGGVDQRIREVCEGGFCFFSAAGLRAVGGV